MDFINQSWCGLDWSEWVPFESLPKHRKNISRSAGLYRVKPLGQTRLAYVGQTGRDLYERVWSLASNTLKDDMPFNDPHTAAPSLWAWKDAEGMQFECSVAPFDQLDALRKGLECNLLWRYRAEMGESTMCNHGRFHKRYVKSRDRKKGQRGYRLTDNEENQNGGPSSHPLSLMGAANSSDFMGLHWTTHQKLMDQKHLYIPATAGMYRLIDEVDGSVIYFGQSSRLDNRLSAHAVKNWGTQVVFSFAVLPDYPTYQLNEIENDLIGGYFEQIKDVPRFQFKNHQA